MPKQSYGDSANFSSALYYKWDKGSDNYYTLTTASVDEKDLTIYLDNTRPDAAGRVTSTQNGLGISFNFKDFSGAEKGGTVFVPYGANIGEIIGDFVNNSAESGGAIYITNKSVVNNIIGNFIGNSSTRLGYGGGAIFSIENIDLVQGYYYDRPIIPEEFVNKYFKKD